MSYKKLNIVIEVGHGGKPHKPLDQGAVYETEESHKSIKLIESNLCLDYASILYKTLRGCGYNAFLVTHDYYRKRAEFSNKINADLFISCHLNSFNPPPKKNQSIVEITENAGEITKEFAEYLSGIFSDRLQIEKHEVRIIKRHGRGWSCIGRVNAPAVLVEPCFLNHNDSHDLLTNNLWKISESIVYAIKTFDWDE